ncbi:hypothetical protein OIDMADRAFT_59156 [Oidiodendron maius Zn]|uniref:Uncharacterized protein n=1 Tax=Oidiodendron maius (strain Zn) TaxID=913774 RepID=A0A0C3GIV3_OIDMZ|nr:hypothetical protein OIDMADRAFT_59156 [Oidiodendron maius Zn]
MTRLTEWISTMQIPHLKKTSSSFVKITAIKLLAYLLAKSNFMSLIISLNILRMLFAASRHIDMRRTVVDGVLTRLRKSSDMGKSAGDEIYVAFMSFSLAAANPSERDTISEEVWLRAEAGGPLPEVKGDRPLLELCIKDAKGALPKRFHPDYVRTVVLPFLAELTKHHSRLMRIFLGRVALTPVEASVTDFGPFGNTAVDLVLEEWTSYLPPEYLICHGAWALSYLACRTLEDIND